MLYSEVLKPYPSGFLGSNLVNQTEKQSDVEKIKLTLDHFFGKREVGNNSNFTSSLDINILYNQYIFNADSTKEFQFVEDVIKAGLKVFGTQTLAQWLSTQSNHKFFTKDHHRFIDETIEFVSTGKPRQYSFNIWNILLNSEKVDITTPKFTLIQQQYLNLPNPANPVFSNLTKTIKQFILDWLKVENGFDDLVQTLFILFGFRR